MRVWYPVIALSGVRSTSLKLHFCKYIGELRRSSNIVLPADWRDKIGLLASLQTSQHTLICKFSPSARHGIFLNSNNFFAIFHQARNSRISMAAIDETDMLIKKSDSRNDGIYAVTKWMQV